MATDLKLYRPYECKHPNNDATMFFDSHQEIAFLADLTSTGTKMPRTNWNDISSFEGALPPNQIPRAFNFAIQPLLNRIHTHLHQSRTLYTLRDTLLQELMSGEMEATGISVDSISAESSSRKVEV